jgi:hypothetical protein
LAFRPDLQQLFYAFRPEAVTSSPAIPYSWQVSRIRTGRLIEQAKRRLNMKSVLLTGSAERAKGRMRRNMQIAMGLCLAVLSTAVDARADCQYVRGSITDTAIPAPNDPIGRTLGNVDGVLNGADTTIVTSTAQPPAPFIVLNAKCLDVFVTKRGDMLTGTGDVTLTPVPGKPPGEFTENEILTVTGGAGKYAGATGTITLEGQVHNLFGPDVGTANLVYQGSVCGPNLKAHEKEVDGN